MTKCDALEMLNCCCGLLDLVKARQGVLMPDDVVNMSIVLDEIRVYVKENVEDDSPKEFPSLKDLGFAD